MRTSHLATAVDPRADTPKASSASDSLFDREMAAEALRIRRRALNLRARATSMDGPLCISYRRRASELMLQAWLLEVRSGLPFADIVAAA